MEIICLPKTLHRNGNRFETRRKKKTKTLLIITLKTDICSVLFFFSVSLHSIPPQYRLKASLYSRKSDGKNNQNQIYIFSVIPPYFPTVFLVAWLVVFMTDMLERRCVR
ncbi:hypothetical protein ES332_D12G142900v1 [Gossypium tomentosum]|uniref:Uncharacterized protein n=1 Tax=Gossypium tomentosum TaxID=34277 RepID=A0A5D2IA07_GOSTO|nr:hypothetical protein ES332_D12G142900v1 [Gossypium tomentosum]